MALLELGDRQRLPTRASGDGDDDLFSFRIVDGKRGANNDEHQDQEVRVQVLRSVPYPLCGSIWWIGDQFCHLVT